MAYTKRILETGTTFLPENDGTWLMTDFTGNQTDDLVYIKTNNTGTNSVEVHVASAASNYQTRIYESGTTFRNETDGQWLMSPSQSGGRPDLVFIKTANTPSGKVEVHIASGESGYKTRTLETATTFACETDGTWLMGDYTGKGTRDLMFIKTNNTKTKSVEVHVASAESKYQTRIYESGSTFDNEDDGAWLLTPFNNAKNATPDLVFIKTEDTDSGRVEVHVASATSKYKERTFERGTTFMPETDGVWTMVPNRSGASQMPNLVFIKTGPNTGTGRVEVHIASGAQ